MEWKHRKRDWYQAASSALNFPVLKEVSQNCFVFHVVNFKSLEEFLRFGAVNIHFLRKSRRIASFWKSRIIASFQIDGWMDRYIDKATDG